MTSTVVTRADPAKMTTSLKEAVVDALLNIVHARIAGDGQYGTVLYGTRPSSQINSAFLLPMRGVEEGDEVTSPIWISSHGLDFQIAKGDSGTIRVQPYFSLYMRILPNEEDLKREDCRPTFRLNSITAKRLKDKLKDALDKKWEEVKGTYESRSKHPQWLKIRDEVRIQIYTAEGVPPNLLNLSAEGEAIGAEDVETAGLATEGVEVKPGTTLTVKDEHFEPLQIPHKWLRLDLELPVLEFSPYASAQERHERLAAHEHAMEEAITKRLADWLENDDPQTGGKLWAFRRGEEIRPSQYRDWNKFLADVRARNNPPALPVVRPRWEVEIAPDWVDPARLNVHIALENRSDIPKQHIEETDPSLFQVSLRVELPDAMHRELKLDRIDPSYRYNQYLGYAAMGFNGGVAQVEASEGTVALQTTWAPRYMQPRVLPETYPGVESNIRKLADPAYFVQVKPIVENFRRWLEELPDRINWAAGLDQNDTEALAREEKKFQEDLEKWASEVEAIEAGLSILEESKGFWTKRGPQSDERAMPFEAWLAMNEAMADMMKARLKDDSAKWHLFQLAFVLANLPAMATRLDYFRERYDRQRDDAVTLLYFATGGGKSEAFFGLLTFTLFFDRLRGKHIGVTSMIRYPLRLLTIQQAQRASKVLARAELVRRRHAYGGMSFSIGFWVGSGGSPNRHTGKGVSDIPTFHEQDASAKEEALLRHKNNKYDVAWRAWNKLPECPFCNAKTGLRRFPKEGGTIAHVCTELQCKANDGTWRPLPFYICDDDIYDFAPSVVLGTVDKLALLGHYPTTIRRVLGMFGAAPWRHRTTGRLYLPKPDELKEGPDARGYDGLKPAYPEGIELYRDPFPALLIQDEAHLLDESLGTFAGLFESTLDAMFDELAGTLGNLVAKDSKGKRRRAKVIAASATVSEPERQLEHLYQRQSPAIQFPHPGPELYASFYARPQEPDPTETARTTIGKVEIRARQARIYCAYMTNGRPHTATSVAVLSSFHLTVSELFNALLTGETAQIERVRETLRRHVSAGPLHDLHDDDLAQASASELATLVDLHRIALTYVTNKKGGDQIMAAESEETRKKHLHSELPFEHLETRLITGSVDQGEIQKVVKIAQERVKPDEAFPPLEVVLRSVIATSAVSHGVDVEEFNSMFFAGMPSDIAEYIQSSSRVGRTHVGFCLLIPTPQRRRDRYIVEVFDIFHRFLERMVQPAAIDRWAEKAVERVLMSLFQAYVCGIIPSRELIETPKDKKAGVPRMEAISEILRLWRRDQKAFVEQVLKFIKEATGLSSQFAPERAPYYVEYIEKRIRELLQRINEQEYASSPLATFFRNQRDPMWRPMMSLRDVDEGGLIRAAIRYPARQPLKPNAVKAVMNLVRHGVAEGGNEPEE